MTEEFADTQPKRRLGRGLNSLLGRGTPAGQESEPEASASLREIPIGGIERNPWQPRKQFDADSMRELSDSIREHGVLQPILVRELPQGGFQLIAGERRWQAAQQAGLTTLPCRVVDVIDQTACEYALEENLKRKDLSDLEKAQAFREYLNQFGTSIENLAKQLSMSRSAVSNMLRLLDLTEPVKAALQTGKISAGHARALLPLDAPGQIELCGRIQAESLNVRQTEAAVRTLTSAEPATVPLPQKPPAAKPQPSNHVLSLQEHLRSLLGVDVEIKLKSEDRGQIVIPFASKDEFENVLRRLRRAAA
ncbi:MAG: ParB/RepB/Spo0J family partition protein [Planctomycetaceae bacterium]